MTLRSRLIQDLRHASGGNMVGVSPNAMCEAVCRILNVPGAGIVVIHRLLRLPIGAAGAGSVCAEQIQVTLGDGPCLSAVASGEPQSFTESALRQRYPIYHAALVAQTPFCSTLSLPLSRTSGEVFAALDVYSSRPDPALGFTIEEVNAEIGELVGMLLLLTLSPSSASSSTPDSSSWPTVRLQRRRQVWAAVGMTMEALRVDDLSALAILRAYAFRHDLLLDDVAGHMVDEGRLTPDVLLDGS